MCTSYSTTVRWRVTGAFGLLSILGSTVALHSGEAALFGERRVFFEHTTRILRAVLTSDESTVYFSDLPSPADQARIWQTRRDETGEFGPATQLDEVVNLGNFTAFPYLSSDDRFLFFSVGHLPENARIFVARRTPNGRFESASRIDVGRTAYMGCVSPDLRELFFVAGALRDRQIWVARFIDPETPEAGVDVGGTQRVEGVDRPADEWPPSISPDARVLLWSHRPWPGSPPPPPGHGSSDIWMAVRNSPNPGSPFLWAEAAPPPPNSFRFEALPSITPNGRTLLFSANDRRIWASDACLARDVEARLEASAQPTVGEEVLFNAEASTTAQGVIESYRWYLGDGEEAEGVRVAHRYAAAGRYRVTLIVKNDQGACNHRVEMVEVTLSTFLRGDCNDDGRVDISDPILTLASLFLGQGDPDCDDACDSNDDGAVDISDAIGTLGVLFIGNRIIPLPGMTQCGVDPTDDEIGCTTFAQCP